MQVWLSTLSPPQGEPSPHIRERFLFPEESAHAAGMLSTTAREHHLWARVLLRASVARIRGVSPSTVTVRKTRLGAPEVDGLFINVTHTEGMVAVVASQNARVGVDVERWDRVVDDRAVASQALSDREARELLALAGEQKRHALMRTWTVKEAYAKAMGMGLTLGVTAFEVNLEGPARLVLHPGVPGWDRTWHLSELDDGDHAIAVCAESERVILERLNGRALIGLD